METKKKKIIIRKVQATTSTKPEKTKDPSKPKGNPKKEKKDSTIAREVKYIYPDGCNDTLSRKTFRGKVRAQLRKYELAIAKAEKGSTKLKKLEKEYKEYHKTVML